MRDGPRARPLSFAWLPLRCLPRAGFWNAKPRFSEGPGMAVPCLREGSSGPPTPVLLCSPDPGDGGPGPCPLPTWPLPSALSSVLSMPRLTYWHRSLPQKP